MLVLFGAFVVMASTLGGFMIAGGNPMVLMHVSEFVVILGVAAGVLIIASPGHILKEIMHKIKAAITGKSPGKQDYFDLLKLLYELFMTGRRNGLIALEEHVMDPPQSAIFQRYPSLLGHPERLQFLCNGLKPVIDGKIKPDQLESLMDAELRAKVQEAAHPVHLLQLVGDSLPGIGIVAAVLGIINTMSAIAEGPEAVGMKVAAALTGTLLGIFVAYGFVNPLANRIQFNDGADQLCLKCIMQAVAGFA
ncbi:MAG: MotA/TolQ/ExbB proton channel family protein, partial [Candidatus Didemnitutus sp.]|nr:MotA/TolQ/ExbB proton channel family protein [Candidatus Didemnitutus sp.]